MLWRTTGQSPHGWAGGPQAAQPHGFSRPSSWKPISSAFVELKSVGDLGTYQCMQPVSAPDGPANAPELRLGTIKLLADPLRRHAIWQVLRLATRQDPTGATEYTLRAGAGVTCPNAALCNGAAADTFHLTPAL